MGLKKKNTWMAKVMGVGGIEYEGLVEGVWDSEDSNLDNWCLVDV